MSLFKHKSSAPAADEKVPATAPVAEATAEVKSTPEVPVEKAATTNTMERFDRLFDEWMLFPFAGWSSDIVKVDREGDALVVRVELLVLDPVKDVELTVSDGVLWIDVAHTDEQRTEDSGMTRHEVRYGAFSRSIPLPEGVTATEIQACAKDGVLEIRIPAPTHLDAEKVPIATA